MHVRPSPKTRTVYTSRLVAKVDSAAVQDG